MSDDLMKQLRDEDMSSEEFFSVASSLCFQAADRIEELEAERYTAKTLMETVAEIMKKASARIEELERGIRQARNEALEEAADMTELYPQPHGSRIANEIRAMKETNQASCQSRIEI